MDVRFLGAVGTVTGSKFLVSSGNTQVLIDCGLFQGLKELRLENWQPLPVDIQSLDGVIITHAHIDHSGYVPALVKQGYKGQVYCTPPTADLCGILLPDSGHIAEEDATYANRKGFSRHRPALPLYTAEDARNSLGRFKDVGFDQRFNIGELNFTFRSAGHILGAANVTVDNGGRSILFSGDIGRYEDSIECQPASVPGADWVVMECTYGDREHGFDKGASAPVQVLADAVQKTAQRGGALLVPSFAVGRTQAVLYALSQAFERGYVDRVPVYVNSPMATKVTELYQRHDRWHRLSGDEFAKACSIATFVSDVGESRALTAKPLEPMVIISASGMLTGGRVLHHLRQLGPDPRNTILLPGFQAAGTRGAALARGTRSLKIHGQHIPIHAEVIHLDIFSAHGDRTELVRWLRSHGRKPEKVFLVHGEPVPRDSFRQYVEENLGYEVVCPRPAETFTI